MWPWKSGKGGSLGEEIQDHFQIQCEQQKSQPRYTCIILHILLLYIYILQIQVKGMILLPAIYHRDYELAHCGPPSNQPVDGRAAGQVPTAI